MSENEFLSMFIPDYIEINGNEFEALDFILQ